MLSTTDTATFFTTGLATSFMAWTLYNQLRKRSPVKTDVEQDDLERRLAKAQDVLTIDALAELVRSTNVSLKESAIQILLDRAMTEENLKTVITAASNRQNRDERKKAIVAIQQLSKGEENRKILVHKGVLKILTDVLVRREPEDEDATCRYAIMALYRLVMNSSFRKKKTVKYGILIPLITILSNCPTHNNDLKYWSLLLIHQFTLEDEFARTLIDLNLIQVLGQLVRLTFGNTNMQKIALHSLVRLVSALSTTELLKTLEMLVDMDMVPMLILCAKLDDIELSSWAVFLIHEFVVKDIARSDFLLASKTRGLLKSFVALLDHDDSIIPRIGLRILKCLGMKNPEFQGDMIKAGVVKKAVEFLREEDDDECPYWAMALLHDLLSHPESHDEFVDANGVDKMCEMIVNRRDPQDTNRPEENTNLMLYVADCCAYLCASPVNAGAVVQSNVIVDAVLIMIKTPDSDLQYAGVALLMTLSTLSSELISKICAKDAIETLSTVLINPSIRENVHIVAAKCIYAIARRASYLRLHILSTTVQPMLNALSIETSKVVKILFPNNDTNEMTSHPASPTSPRMGLLAQLTGTNNTNTIGSEPPITPPTKRSSPLITPKSPTTKTEKTTFIESCKFLTMLLECLSILMGGHRNFNRMPTPDGGELTLEKVFGEEKVLDVVGSVLDLLVLPLMKSENGTKAESFDKETKPSKTSTATSKAWDPVLESMGEQDKHVFLTGSEEETITSDMGLGYAGGMNELKRVVTQKALEFLTVLYKYKFVMKFLIKEKFFVILVALLREPHIQLTNEILTALGSCISKEGTELELFRFLPFSITDTLRLSIFQPSRVEFYGNVYLSALANHSHSRRMDDEEYENQYVELNKVDKTSSLILSLDRREIRNDGWGFESVRANTGFIYAGKYGYEVELKTDGIIQIGWATKSCRFDPEAGTGVGDDRHSYAYDGRRKKRWHGELKENNDYGDDWIEGDIITVLLDLDNGTISYLQNGISLGVAFRNIDTTQQWFPAISVATNQGCRVVFGDALVALRHLPSGYMCCGEIATSLEKWKSMDSLGEALKDGQEVETQSRMEPTEQQKPKVKTNLSTATTTVSSPTSNSSSPKRVGRTMRRRASEDGEEEGEDIPLSRSPSPLSLHSRSPSPLTPANDPEFSPWFYYEMTVGLRGLDPKKFMHFGLRDRENNVYFIIPYQNAIYFLQTHHTLFDKTFYIKQLIDIIDAHYTSTRRVGGNEEEEDEGSSLLVLEGLSQLEKEVQNIHIVSDSPSSANDNADSSSYKLLSVIWDLPITDGTVLGCGLDMTQNTIAFTMNGKRVGPMIPVKERSLHMPYYREVPRFVLNFGARPFRFSCVSTKLLVKYTENP